MGGGVGGMFTPTGPPLALRNLMYVAHDVANGRKVARVAELSAVTPLVAQVAAPRVILKSAISKVRRYEGRLRTF